MQNKIKIGKPIFKREVRIDTSRAGYMKLLGKLNESEMCIRQIKNGQTIFDQDVMRTKYANPYFQNEHMNNKLLSFVEKRNPKLNANPNINMFEEDQLKVPDKTNQEQANWVKLASSRCGTSSTMQQY